MDTTSVLAVFPPAFFVGSEMHYAIRLVTYTDIAGKVTLDAALEVQTDEEAIASGKQMAKQLKCDLDLEYLTGQYILHEQI